MYKMSICILYATHIQYVSVYIGILKALKPQRAKASACAKAGAWERALGILTEVAPRTAHGDPAPSATAQQGLRGI